MPYASLIKACICDGAIQKALPELRKTYGNLFCSDVQHAIWDKLWDEEDNCRKGKGIIGLDGSVGESVIEELSKKIPGLYEEALKIKKR